MFRVQGLRIQGGFSLMYNLDFCCGLLSLPFIQIALVRVGVVLTNVNQVTKKAYVVSQDTQTHTLTIMVTCFGFLGSKPVVFRKMPSTLNPTP